VIPRLLKRRRRSIPRHLAAEALRRGDCMFCAFGDCAGAPAPFGLRDPDDDYAEILTRYLADAFAPRNKPHTRADDEGYVRMVSA
jgi:hypothetical protein